MKMPTSSLSRLCGAVLLAIAGSACSGVSSTSTPEAAPSAPSTPAPPVAKVPAPVRAAAPASDTLQQLRAEIGSAACDSAQQCKTIAVGHKACGGPETYLAWSSKTSDAAKVRSLADAHGAKRKSENMASGMASNCMVEMDPGATCSAGRCVTGGGNAAI